jgi:O-methyltransferase involved in polyketide biosynthesis
MTRQGSGPAFDTATANAARIYDFLLGGKDHFAADREAARLLVAALPGTVRACQDNRAFLQRAVRHLAQAGIRQFLDIGAGLPAMGSVHESAPGARVAYVDYDPVVIAHAKALLATTPDVIAAEGDLRRPQAITADPAIRAHLDFTRPVAVLLAAVLHFITDDDQPRAIVKSLMDALPVGSALVLSHVTADHVTPRAADAARAVYDSASAPVIPRTLAEVTGLFDGLKLTGPGVTAAGDWHPGAAPAPARAGGPVTYIYAGVAVKH